MNALEDLVEEIQSLKAQLASQVAALTDLIEIKTQKLEQMMRVTDTPKVVAPSATAYFKKVRQIELTDFDQVLRYAVVANAPDLIERRVARKALELRIETGEEIPGVKLLEAKETFIIQAARKGKE